MKMGALGGLACYVAYPTLCTDTQLFYQQTAFNRSLLSRCNSYLKAYLPSFGISGAERQLIFNVFFTKDIVTKINYERTNLIMEDGGTISIDWAIAERNTAILNPPSLPLNKSSKEARKRKVCLVLPGLSGDSDRGYLKSLVKTMISDGFEVAVFHNRGVGNTPYTSL